MELLSQSKKDPQNAPRTTLKRRSSLFQGVKDAQEIGVVQVEEPTENPKLGPKSFAQNTLKSWGLHSLYRLFQTVLDAATKKAKASIKTHKKVVIFKSRPMALLASAVHLPPIVATAVMSRFLYKEHWVGGTLTPNGKWDTEADLAIQFTAKFLELFMVASLTTMMFTFILREITIRKGLPLAAILAATDFKSPSFVWSDEFFAMILAPFSCIWKKAFLLCLTLVCALLAMVVAPATATILLPREDWYTMGGTTIFINATNEDIFPTIINANHTLGGGVCETAGVSHCPSSGWDSLKHLAAYFPSQKLISYREGVLWQPMDSFVLPTLQARILMSIRTRHPYANEGPQFNLGDLNWIESLVNLPHHTSAAALVGAQAFWSPAMRMRSLETDSNLHGTGHRFTSWHQVAALQTRCQATISGPTDLFIGEQPLLFPNIMWGGAPYLDTSMRYRSIETFIGSLNRTAPQILFFDLEPTDPFASRVSIGSVVSIPLQNGSLAMYGCFTNARWRNQTLETRLDQPIQGNLWPYNPQWKGDITVIHSSYANLTNPRVGDTDARVFQHLAEAARLSENAETRLNWTFGPVETIINGMLGNGMARTAPYAGPIWSLKDANDTWWRHFFSHRGTIDTHENFNNTAFDVPREDQARLAKLNFMGESFGVVYPMELDKWHHELKLGFNARASSFGNAKLSP
ncbi:hypothetical protein CkaCkLH20_11204 [Colletotrichum karsti]|uniref:Uncharacterized protein n=1 Tax=Colletotrichum karsti TaxID=1095194 RepID=A0A9P6HU87_9PEZI|nr:uncharacterized protein CkaCkLH20_11204 [Colletotrichum karsti]KAF9871283.1 hypothetical protein CkaCkLH20_11204 [Colletotrichum karsti]